MDKVIDIIIPGYNAHNTIGKTLGSIVAQTMADRVRVTIVNDCSEKDYSEFVESYKQMLDIREITLTEHHGCGRTRNVGLDNAEYQYIMFIDADDLLSSPRSIQTLYEIASHDNKLNIVYGGFNEELNDGSLYYHPSFHFIWIFASLFKRSFIEENNIRFIDSSSGEDAGFNKHCKMLCRPENIYFLDEVVYYWSNLNKDNRINTPEFLDVEGRVGYAKNIVEVYKLLKHKNIKCTFNESKVDYLGNLVSVYFLSLLMEQGGFDKYLLVNIFKEYYKDWKDMFNQYITYDDYLLCFENNFNNHFLDVQFANVDYSFNDYIYDLSEGEDANFLPELENQNDNGLFFSIIIPAHNCEKTIGRLMNSILRQKLYKDVYEVIFVDDNCTDNSVEKVEKYKDLLNLKIIKTDTDVHCPGNSRNAGLEVASGRWVTFIDNDDMFADETLGTVRNIIIQNHLQYVYFTLMKRINYFDKSELEIYNTPDVFLHGKFYNRQFLQDNNINFTKDLKTNEDSNFNFKVFNALNLIKYEYYYDSYATYIWINENSSLSNNGFDNYTCYIETYFNDYIDSLEPFFIMNDYCISKLIEHLIKGYFYYQSSLWKRGSGDKLVNENYNILKNFVYKILKFLNISKNELISSIYSNPFEYGDLRKISALSSYPFVETQSLIDFIQEV